MEINLKSTNAPDYFLRANKAVWKRYAIPALIKLAYLLIVAVVLISYRRGTGNISTVPYGSGLAFVFIVLYSGYNLLRQRVIFINSIKALTPTFGASNSFSVEITDQHFIYKDENSTITRSWSSFTQFSETKEYIFLYTGNPFPIEKNALSATDLEEFRALLRSKLPLKKGMFG